MITIDNLTKEQVKLLDIMWSYDDVEAYEKWKSSQTIDRQKLITTLEQLVLLADIDRNLEGKDSYPNAESVLSKFFKKENE